MIDYTSKSDYSDSFIQIKTNKKEGLIYKDFLNSPEIQSLLLYYKNHPDKHKNKNFSISFPPLFSELSEDTTDFRIKQKYNLAIKELKENPLVYTFFEKISKNFVDFKIGRQVIKNEAFAPFSFRELKPLKGRFLIHDEKITFSSNRQIINTNNIYIENYHVYSFFILLQKPILGGNFYYFKEKNSETKKKRLNLNVGDMLIFSSYTLLHKVSIVMGFKSRITIGGFILVNKEGDDILLIS